MAKRTASAVWEGTLREGKGTSQIGQRRPPDPSPSEREFQYSFASRFEEGTGTNPEELIGAAHAGCFSMALAAGLTKAGFNPTRISTKASVSLEKVGEGFKITTIELNTEGEVPDYRRSQHFSNKQKPRRRIVRCRRRWRGLRLS